MKFYKTTRSRSRELAPRKVKSSDRMPSLMTPGHDRPQYRQIAKNALTFSLHGVALFLAALLIAGLWVSPSGALDYPHNDLGYASLCQPCHVPHSPAGGGLVSPTDGCLTCHNGGTATLAATHSSANTSTQYGDWAIQCSTCHEPHKQDQRIVHGEASYLASGTSDPGGITENSLMMSGAGWAENSLADMVLFPNLAQPSYSYKIIGNTADTITVIGPMNLAMTTTGNSSFAVMYGKLIRGSITTPNSGDRAVRFFSGSGANSFADGDATYDGICEVCHTQAIHHRNDGTATTQSHNDGTRCTGCHSHSNGFGGFNHGAAGAILPDATCIECHGSPDSDLIADVHSNQCELCHIDLLGGGPLLEPYETTWPNGGYCTDCHGSLTTAHPNVDHTATPGSGSVVIFPDSGHDDAGWVGAKPYFDVIVDCTLCHDTNLVTLHGNNCATCHPSPRDSLGTWNGGCQQGGCHTSFHQESITAHSPFEDTSGGTANDCSRCHSGWSVPQSNCLNCHAAIAAGDTTPPVTTSNALAVYNGPARIDFSITDNGKVGIGTTFYKLDGGPVAAGSYALANTAGPHTLEFWSVDQAGNIESPTKFASFDVVLDTTPPTTTSNAQANYNQIGGAITITLSATDDSSWGVKATYYRLGAGTVQSGTSVTIPVAGGINTYTLAFWSEDWSGNIEAENSVTFTVTSGAGTIRLVWGGSDTDGSPCGGDPDANAAWTIRKGNMTGPVVASGAGGCPNWDGVEDIVVQVGPTPYFVIVDWWDSYWEIDEQTVFPNVYVTTPGQVALRRY